MEKVNKNFFKKKNGHHSQFSFQTDCSQSCWEMHKVLEYTKQKQNDIYLVNHTPMLVNQHTHSSTKHGSR